MGAVGLREDIKGEVTLRRSSQMDFLVQLGFNGILHIEDKGYEVELGSLDGKTDAEKRMRMTTQSI